jgi:hypothetical protein
MAGKIAAPQSLSGDAGRGKTQCGPHRAPKCVEAVKHLTWNACIQLNKEFGWGVMEAR